MSTSNAIVLYLVIWWVSLFLFLPLNIKSPKNVKKGNDPGAPEKPEIRKKFLTTTIFSIFVWIVIFVIMKY